MNRRAFLKTAVAAAVPTAPVAAASYGLFEAGWVQIERPELPLPNLPRSFDGLRVAFLTDVHHGPYTPLDYVAAVVRTTMNLRPDLVIHGGDYSLKDTKYIAPCFDVLAGLSAPLGVYGVLGNHDYRNGVAETRAGMTAAGVTELTNRGTWVGRGGSRFWLGGVDDLWFGNVDVAAALGPTKPGDGALVVSHNPDVAETVRDRRVGLMLSGHTHGGQGVFPGVGAPFVPSRYGMKYLKGRVEAPATTVYVSRGLGTTMYPLRYGSRPELTLLTLRCA
jgi:predicted MPP superfamily phosphohydrolase